MSDERTPDEQPKSAVEEAGGWKHWIEANTQGSSVTIRPLKTWPLLGGSVTRR